MKKRIAIVGSGPAGITAAISASRFAKDNVEVHVFEQRDALLKTILATGNGRCNFSNVVIDMEKYHNAEFADEFNSFKEKGESVCEILSSLGLEITTNDAGLMFPASMKASSVRDVLLNAFNETNAIVHLNEKMYYEEAFYGFDLGIIASGHYTFFNGVDWQDYEKRLCPIITHDDVSVADNVRTKVKLTVLRGENVIFEESGEVQFRKYGISGIVAFNASRYVEKYDVIRLDFTDGCLVKGNSKEHFRQRFEHCRCNLKSFFQGFVHDDVAKLIISRMRNKDSFDDLYNLITAFELKADGLLDDDKLFQVCRGGVMVNRVCSETLRVDVDPSWYPSDLYVCGEAIDVDGPCGGYNLTWAFESGWRAGKCAALNLRRK